MPNKTVFFIFLSFFNLVISNAKTHELSLITFNIKVDSKADGVNQWKIRKPLVMKFLSKEVPDILCLQEVLNKQLDDIRIYLWMYDYVGVSRVDGKSKGDFVPIFYRKDKFEQIDGGTFCLSEKPDSIGSIGWDAKYPRIATWINLRIIETGETLFVINTHLDNVGRTAKVKGIKLILDTIPFLSKSDKILLTGDFNASETSNVHHLVLQKHLNDVYQICQNKTGVHYTFHQFGQKEIQKRKRIDYIFASKNFKVISVNVPKEKSRKGVYISDHNPVIVKMKLLE